MSKGNSTTVDSAEALPFNPNLHGLRGIAALAVLLFHWGSEVGFFPQARRQVKLVTADESWDFGILIDFGWLGVPLFFVLSGYLLTRQLILRKLDGRCLCHFWLRRPPQNLSGLLAAIRHSHNRPLGCSDN